MLHITVTEVTYEKYMTFPLNLSPKTFSKCVLNKVLGSALPTKRDRQWVNQRENGLNTVN